MRYLQGTPADCATWKAALDTDAGMPQRGVTYGGPDRVHPTAPGPGWTITVTHAVVDAGDGTAALEIPDDQQFRLGRRGTPTLAQSKDETALPTPLLTAVRASKGLNPDGTRKPFP